MKSHFKKICFAAVFVPGMIFLTGCTTGRTATIATYNIQIGLGLDKKYDLNRTAETIRGFEAETVILNEVDVKTDRSKKIDQPAFLGKKLGMNYVFGEASKRPGGVYGNAVLSVYTLEKLDVINIPANGYETRSALVVKVNAPTPYYVIATHFAFEQNKKMNAVRVKCIDLLADYMAKKKYSPVLFCGDFNAYHNSEVIRRVQERGIKILNDLSGRMLSYPSAKPRRLLDYITVYPANSAEGKNIRVIDTQASDHAPVVAEIIFK